MKTPPSSGVFYLFCTMKVTDHIKNAKKTLFSIEILPPLKGKSIKSIYDLIDPLMEFKPPFIDVTYHREEYIYKNVLEAIWKRLPSANAPEQLEFARQL
jgi:methylenetetrahydrofolate reductase (NADPH)